MAGRLWVRPGMPRLRWGSCGSGSGACPQSRELAMGPDRIGFLRFGYWFPWGGYGSSSGCTWSGGSVVGLAEDATALARQL